MKIKTIGIVKIAITTNKILLIFSIGIKIDKTNNIKVYPAKNPIKKPKMKLNW
jgi:hypothetical protein